MDTIKKFFSWIKEMPRWAQVVAIISAATLIILFGFTSCGATSRVVVQTDNNSQVSVSVNQSPSNDVDVSPDIDATYNPVTRTIHIRKL